MAFVVLSSLFLAAATLAAPGQPQRRDCTESWPSYPDTNTLNTIYAICMQRNVTDKVLLATFETAWVESRVWPLDCGDQDSVGVFQQRPSQGWGTVEQCMDPVYATNKYLDDCIWNDIIYPNITAGQLAQSVQRSEFPTRYDENEATGRQLIVQARANAAAMSSSSSSSSSSTSTSTSTSSSTSSTTSTTTTSSTSTTTSTSTFSSMATSTTTSHSATPSTTKPASTTTTHSTTTTTTTKTTTTTTKTTSTPVSNVKVPSPLTSGTITKGCDAYIKGSTCPALQKKYSVTLAQLRFWNPKINSSCSNMSKSTYYCVKSKTVAPPSTVASGTIKTGCTTYALVKSGTTCTALIAKYKISITTLRKWNTAVNSKCSNLQANKSYCVAAV